MLHQSAVSHGNQAILLYLLHVGSSACVLLYSILHRTLMTFTRLQEVATVHVSVSPKGSTDMRYTKPNFIHSMLNRYKVTCRPQATRTQTRV